MSDWTSIVWNDPYLDFIFMLFKYVPTGLGSGGTGGACGILASVEGLLVCKRLVIVYLMLGFLEAENFGLLLLGSFETLSSSDFSVTGNWWFRWYRERLRW